MAIQHSNNPEFTISFPDSAWKLKLKERGQFVIISLHWGDKAEPTHTTCESKLDFFNMAKALTVPT